MVPEAQPLVHQSQLRTKTRPIEPRRAFHFGAFMAHKVPFIVAELGSDVDPFVLDGLSSLKRKSIHQCDPFRCHNTFRQPRRKRLGRY
jgi:hypothetical protein